MTLHSASSHPWLAIAAAACISGAVLLPGSASANTIQDVAVALRSGDNTAACRAFGQYERSSIQFNQMVSVQMVREILQGQPPKYWYEAAQASQDHAVRCIDLYRAEFAERQLQISRDWDQTTFDELRKQAIREYNGMSGKLVLAPTAPSMNVEGSARYEFVYHHPSSAGLPTSCQANWSNDAQVSEKCAQDLYAQAEIERKTGNCMAALTDYKNARTAADNAGMGTAMQVQITGGMSQCQAH